MVTLSVLSSTLLRLDTASADAREWDSGYDAGEFSGPAHYRLLKQETREALADAGWTARSFLLELHARVSSRWVFYRCFDLSVVEEIADEEWEARSGERR
jgi:hypothetical protein